jgi:hypothetical protein
MPTHNITPRRQRWLVGTQEVTAWVAEPVACVYSSISEAGVLERRFDLVLRPPHHSTISLNPLVNPLLWAKGNSITWELQSITGGTWYKVFDGFLIDATYDDGRREFGGSYELPSVRLEVGDLIALQASRKPPDRDTETDIELDIPISSTIDYWLNKYGLKPFADPVTGTVSSPVAYSGSDPITEHIGRILFANLTQFYYSDRLGDLRVGTVRLATEVQTPKLTELPSYFVDFIFANGEREKPVAEVIVTGSVLVPTLYEDPPVLVERIETELGWIVIRTTRTRTTRLVTEQGPVGIYLADYQDPDVDPDSTPPPAEEDLYPYRGDTGTYQASTEFEEKIFGSGVYPRRLQSVTILTRQMLGSFLPFQSVAGARSLGERSLTTKTFSYSPFGQVREEILKTREPRDLVSPTEGAESASETPRVISEIDAQQWFPFGNGFTATRTVRRPYDPPQSQRPSSSPPTDQPPEVEYEIPDYTYEQQAIEAKCLFEFPEGSPAYDRTRTYDLGPYLSSNTQAEHLCLVLGTLLQGRTQLRQLTWVLTDSLLNSPIKPGDRLLVDSGERPGWQEVLLVDSPGIFMEQDRVFGAALGIFTGWRNISTGTIELIVSAANIVLGTSGDISVSVRDPLNSAQDVLVLL